MCFASSNAQDLQGFKVVVFFKLGTISQKMWFSIGLFWRTYSSLLSLLWFYNYFLGCQNSRYMIVLHPEGHWPTTDHVSHHMNQGVKKKHGSLPSLGPTGETSETLLSPPSGELLRSIEARCERRLRHLGRDLRIALKLAGVVSRHLSSMMVILSGYRWPPLLLSNTICLLCTKCEHRHPQRESFLPD